MKQHKISEEKKGFTLIELLVVIAIVAILAVVLVLTLNPAQLLRQARDSTRISDFATLKSALSLYLADVASPSLSGGSSTCYAHASSSVPASSGCSGRYTTATNVSTSALRNVTGTGWIPVNFNAISSGAPISVEPIDPINNATNFYSYAADTTNQTFELNAKMESTRYASGGSGDVESTDGGSSSTVYEVGTAPGLSL
ncbi:MAG: type II secretion system GspH family protein [Patescibacteria group bacterium]|nr:type II secretion system GspH family protein [Patescibacteria group bacterium]